MANELMGATTELLQTLIRNECVNDGTPDSGRRGAQRRAAASSYLEGAGVGHRAVRARDPGAASIVARIEGTDPDAPTLCLMGHTDVVPVNPAGWSRGPVRRRADRRRGVGPRRDRHAQHHGVDGGRRSAQLARSGLAAEGHADLLRRRRRGGRRQLGRRVDVRPPLGRDRAATTCSPRSAAGRRSGRDDVRHVVVNTGEKGIAWRRLRVARHAGARLDAVRRRQRADQGGRGGAPAGRTTARSRRSPTCGRRRSRRCRCPTTCSAGLLDPARIWATLRDPAAAAGAHLPRPHAHDVLAERRPRRAEDEHHPRRRRPRGRHPHRARARRAPTSTRMLHEALGELADHVEVEPHPGRRPDRVAARQRRCGTRSADATQVAYPGAELLPGLDRRRHRRALLPGQGRGRLRRRAVLPAVTLESFGTRFHGNDERIDVESLGLSADFWIHIAKEICG